MATRAPFPYYGGKQSLVPTLLNLMPPHQVYVEVFGGGASLLLNKPRVKLDVYNDLDGELVNFFRVLRDARQAKRLHALLELTPYARDEWIFCKDRPATLSAVERARRFYVRRHQTFSGAQGGWSFSTEISANKGHKFTESVRVLPAFTERLRRVQIDHIDMLTCLRRYDRPGTLFYLDPPYLMETRNGTGYHLEMSKDEHIALLEAVQNLAGMAILSGYASPLYTEYLAGWRRYDVASLLRSNNKRITKHRQARTECIWLSPRARAHQPMLTFGEPQEAL